MYCSEIVKSILNYLMIIMACVLAFTCIVILIHEIDRVRNENLELIVQKRIHEAICELEIEVVDYSDSSYHVYIYHRNDTYEHVDIKNINLLQD